MDGFYILLKKNLKMHLLPITMAMLAILLFQCSPTTSLSDTEKAKLDPPLNRLFAGEQIDKNLVGENLRPDGTKEYAVIVRSEHPEEIKALGVAISSVFGDVIVVHATIKELRKIVSLASVHAIGVGSKKTIQRPQ